ncbi:MAG: hypothetical protein CMC15_17655 [Flavobacteriaceae bacterium]|nr:hypothetical protein [Flavobacteriaceae bacterium]|tara:strand:- start:1970 stop:2521 length:552 start_codon:yes stop_codon:yes gene_type:complete
MELDTTQFNYLKLVWQNGGTLDPSKPERIFNGHIDGKNNPYLWNFLVRKGLLSTPDEMTRERLWSSTVFPSLVELTDEAKKAMSEFCKREELERKSMEYYYKIHALVEELNVKFPEAGLSFGYIGNYERWGDDTSWYIFSNLNHRWGGYPGANPKSMEKMYNWAWMELETRLTNICGGSNERA